MKDSEIFDLSNDGEYSITIDRKIISIWEIKIQKKTTVQAVVFFCGILCNKINFGGGAVFV